LGLALAGSRDWLAALASFRQGLTLLAQGRRAFPELALRFSTSGQEAARQGDWPAATEAFLQACLWGPPDRDGFQNLALSQWAGGNRAGYRRTCHVFQDQIEALEGRRPIHAGAALLCQGLAASAPGGGVAAAWSLPLGWQGAHWAFEEEIGEWAVSFTDTCIRSSDGPVAPLRLVALAERVVRIFPSTPNGHANLGAALYRAGKYPQALSPLARAVELQKRDVSAWYLLFLGMTHHRLGHAGEADQALKKAEAEHEKQKGTYDWQTRLLFDRLQAEARELVTSR
jgi:tetratricopeptide (TPR) repeat protein